MSFQFKKSSVVVVGTFNIYIIQPSHLAQMGLWGVDDVAEMQTDLNRPGFRFRISGAKTSWNVRPDRVTVESTESRQDCGTPLAAVLGNLKWTPLVAVGTNLEFEAEYELLERMKFKFADLQAPGDFKIRQRTFHRGFSRAQQHFNIQVTADDSERSKNEATKLRLAINVHTPIPDNTEQLKAIELGKAACEQFAAHSDEAIALAAHLLGVEVVL